MAKILLARITAPAPPVQRLRLVGTISEALPGIAYESRLSIVGGGATLTASVRTGTRLPLGLSLSIDYGTRELVVSGTALESGAVYTELQVSDEYGQRAVRAVSWLLQAPPLSITGTLAAAEQGVAYSSAITASGGVLPYTWSVTGALPAGLTIDPGTGVISGTPTATGTFAITVTVTDSISATASSGQTISVAAYCDPYFSSVVSLLHFDGADGSTTFTDSTGRVWTPAGNVKISTARSMFGGASAAFDGSGDYLSAVIANAIGVNDFTVEAFLYINSLSSDGEIFCISAASLSVFAFNCVFEYKTSGAIRGSIQNGSGAANVDITSAAGVLTSGNWVHVAFVAHGSTARLFVGGLQVQTGSISGTRVNSHANCRIGHLSPDLSGSVTRYLNGNMDGFRLTKGVARYTSNFTPPTRAFPDVACV